MLQKYRERWPWFDHLVAAAMRYQAKKGDYFGAGITYFSVFALFPLIMVAFAIGGYILAGNAELLDDIKEKIAGAVSDQSVRDSINQLIDQAIDSRGTVGVIGLAGALWAGLGWMANVRAGLTEMWDSEVPESNFVKTKLGDLGALAGLFVALVACVALMAAGSSPLTGTLLAAVGLDHAPGLHFLISGATLLISLLAMWVLWTFVIARLPRVQFPWRNAARAGLLTAVAFTILTQLATLLIGSVMKARGRHVRPDPRHHAVHLLHRPDRAVRDRVGRDRPAQPALRDSGGAGPGGHLPGRPAGVGPGAGRSRRCRGPDRGRRHRLAPAPQALIQASTVALSRGNVSPRKNSGRVAAHASINGTPSTSMPMPITKTPPIPPITVSP